MSMLEVVGLQKQFAVGPTKRGKPPAHVVHAVEGVSFSVDKGEVLTIVGESGCGKSTIARMLVGLVEPTAGTIWVDGHELGAERTQADRRRIQLVAQNPWSALNRRRSIRHALEQALLAHRIGASKAERTSLIETIIERVGLHRSHLDQQPSGVSGGELARAVLARALLLSPQVLVLDEPTASLDVSVKATVVNLLLDLQAELGLTMVLITHEIEIARKLADHANVMYLGRMVESGTGPQVLEHPRHPYARMLLASMPVADPHARVLNLGTGEVPSAINPPSGCAFHPRCSYAIDRCRVDAPVLRIHGDRVLSCHLADQLGSSEAKAAQPVTGVLSVDSEPAGTLRVGQVSAPTGPNVEGCPVVHQPQDDPTAAASAH